GPPIDTARANQIRSWIESGFARFERDASREDAPAAYGLARAARGFVIWQANASEAGRSEAARLFAEAREHMSDYAAARNLAAITRPLAQGTDFDSAAAATLHRELLAAVGLDPRDVIVLDNLERVYRALLATPVPEVVTGGSDLVQERLDVVRAARAKAPGAPTELR